MSRRKFFVRNADKSSIDGIRELDVIRPEDLPEGVGFTTVEFVMNVTETGALEATCRYTFEELHALHTSGNPIYWKINSPQTGEVAGHWNAQSGNNDEVRYISIIGLKLDGHMVFCFGEDGTFDLARTEFGSSTPPRQTVGTITWGVV